MTPATRELLAQEYASLALYASIHNGDPGTTGANQVGSRQPITWNTDGAGTLTSDLLVFAITAPEDLTHVGIWSASTSGTFRDSVVNAISFSDDGDYSFTLTYAA